MIALKKLKLFAENWGFQYDDFVLISGTSKFIDRISEPIQNSETIDSNPICLTNFFCRKFKKCPDYLREKMIHRIFFFQNQTNINMTNK